MRENVEKLNSSLARNPQYAPMPIPTYPKFLAIRTSSFSDICQLRGGREVGWLCSTSDLRRFYSFWMIPNEQGLLLIVVTQSDEQRSEEPHNRSESHAARTLKLKDYLSD